MTDLVRLLVEIFRFIWPFRKIEAWERGFYTIFGRVLARERVKPLGPGVYPVFPFFVDVRSVSTVPGVVTSPLCAITLSDGRSIAFAVSATIVVTNPMAAVVDVEFYQETAHELIYAIASEKLAEVDSSRLEPKKRKALLNDLRRWIDEETSKFGVSVLAIRFTSFVLNIRTYRLLTDSALPPKLTTLSVT